MNRHVIFLIIALLVAASIGAARADTTTHIPLVRGGIAGAETGTATDTPTSTPTATTEGDTPTPTNTPTPTGTATSTPTQTPTVTATATEQSSGPCQCGGDFYNCTDFSTHSQAQACFSYCVSQGAGDIHKLDQDNDGIACESLPGGFRVVR